MATVFDMEDDDLTGEISDAESSYAVTPEPFTEAGTCDDEVTLEFDNNERLFVSRNFLRYSSPVFKAMFNGEYKEKLQNRVELPGKDYDDFLTFLKCIHPGIMNPVDDSNVLRIAAIAEEYQVAPIQNACIEFMKKWLNDSINSARSCSNYLSQSKPLRQCLHILKTASMLNYEDVITLAIETTARFGHVLYIKGHYRKECSYVSSRKSEKETIEKECLILFDNLPATLRCNILCARLIYFRDYDLK